ncbi:hypothetical protein [Mangrovicoccus ximenensis]|uniref:hypothetical protein n=1 Tax=Mangrovicoccus ximenensis TaxID=1911570 RepID=UPI00191C21C6|nr:hypothetical protein [Mangrovicoccus ximenensis]
MNRYFAQRVSADDVTWSYAGIRPLYDDKAANASAVTRDYVLDLDADDGDTVDELYAALEDARTNSRIGVVLLTGNGPSPKDGGWAFCSGGDQRIRGRDDINKASNPSNSVHFRGDVSGT